MHIFHNFIPLWARDSPSSTITLFSFGSFWLENFQSKTRITEFKPWWILPLISSSVLELFELYKISLNCFQNLSDNDSKHVVFDRYSSKAPVLTHQQQKHVVFDRWTMTIPFCFRPGWLVHLGRNVWLPGSSSQGCSPTSRESQCWSTSATKGTNSIKLNIQLPDIFSCSDSIAWIWNEKTVTCML